MLERLSPMGNTSNNQYLRSLINTLETVVKAPMPRFLQDILRKPIVRHSWFRVYYSLKSSQAYSVYTYLEVTEVPQN